MFFQEKTHLFDQSTNPAIKLLEVFKALDVNPENEADCLLAIIADSPHEKKLAIAQYVHQLIPSAPSKGYQRNYI